MTLYFNDTSLEITADDNSKAVEKVRAVDTLTLNFSMPEYVDIPVGAWATFEGKRYELLDPKNFKKNNTRNFEYTLVLEDEAGRLRRYKFRDSNTRRLKFDNTARPHEHIEMLVWNLNQRESGWTVGECVEAVEKAIAFNHTSCWDGLEQIADAFGTEWEIEVSGEAKKIHLRKVEYFKDNPLPLSYGKGNGFKPGLGRSNFDKTSPVEILYPQGSDRNINAATYGSTELLLPKDQIIGFDGSDYYYNQNNVPADKEVKWYVTDADGYSVRRMDKALITSAEQSLDCSHIYPSRIGTISEVITVNLDKHLYDIVDSSIPEDLDFKKYLIPGQTLTIILQEGMLAGKELDAKYIHEDRRFEIVPQDLDGRTMPDETFKPLVGQKYAVFGMMMPDEYLCDNNSHTGASWDMFRECVRYFYDNEDPHFSFTGELDSIWAKKDWVNIGGRIRKGAYIAFSDDQFQQEGVDIRIVTVTRPVNEPKKPKIELSNVTVSGSFIGELNKIDENEVISDNQYRDAIQFTKRRYRDAIETIEMLEEALLGFSDSINPIAVNTMSLLVGDESLQYRFVNNKTNPITEPHIITYDIEAKQLRCPAGIIQHMTLGIKDISSSHKVSDYSFWDVGEWNSARLSDPKKKYYLYIRASKTSQVADFRLSETAIEMNSIAGYYHFLCGILNSEYDGDRSFVELYGFTEILPGRITTDRVVSADGLNFLDFVNNAFRVGNGTSYLDWNSRGDNVLRLKGTIVQSQSGAEDVIGVYVGEWRSWYTYVKGDEVYHNKSTYRWISDTWGSGIEPDVTAGWESYWRIQAAKGEDGHDGPWTSFVYKAQATQPATPTGTNPVPSGWFERPPVAVSLRYSGDNWTDEGDYKRSPVISHGGFTKQMAIFTTYGENVKLRFEIKAYSQTNADFMLMGRLDTTLTTTSYLDRISGNGQSKTIEVTVPNAGSHFIEFGYSKNASISSYGDYGLYRLVSVEGDRRVWLSQARVTQNDAGEWLAGEWSEPIQFSGESGENGASGPMPRVSKWSATGQYEYSDNIVDVVYVLDTSNNPVYYQARKGIGIIPIGTLVTNTTYWGLMNWFDNVATNLVIANMALIAGFRFYADRIESQKETDGRPNIRLDGITGTMNVVGSGGDRMTLDTIISSGALRLTTSEGVEVGLLTMRNQDGIKTAYLNLYRKGTNDEKDTTYGPTGIQFIDMFNNLVSSMSATGLELGTNQSTSQIIIKALSNRAQIYTKALPISGLGLNSGEWYADANDGYSIKMKP